MDDEKIMARHPDPAKQGTMISKRKYEAIREAIEAVLAERGEVPFADLTPLVEQRVMPGFVGSVAWYVTTVKLDLEARGVVERVPDASPQVVRLAA